ncbi:transmembrane protein 107-like isoform X2 [Stegodyphus dumicola]|uniref:transmembrane protein 107-like isoform X2 n=1 Tax=Stegodyphus dumicola TaxID=202533 RepID=UPI0015AD4F0F|nr:transmembrane protein 107-like isoform X2 [Stegodyphus dumicola]
MWYSTSGAFVSNTNLETEIAKKIVPVHLLDFNNGLKTKSLEDILAAEIEKLTIFLGSSIALIVAELCLFLGGLSMFTNWQCQLSILCHFTGACALYYILLKRWEEEVFIVVFTLCIVLPAVTEVFNLFRYCVRNM